MTRVILFQKFLFQPMTVSLVRIENMFPQEEHDQCTLSPSIHGIWGIRVGKLQGILDNKAGHQIAGDLALVLSLSHNIHYVPPIYLRVKKA